jgi:hypothetical protein
MKKHKVREGMIISRDNEYVHEADGHTIRVVPAYKRFSLADADHTREDPR